MESANIKMENKFTNIVAKYNKLSTLFTKMENSFFAKSVNILV